MAEIGRNPARTFPTLSEVDDTDSRARGGAEPIWPGRPPEAFAERRLIALCPYDAVRLDDSAPSDAGNTHPKIR